MEEPLREEIVPGNTLPFVRNHLTAFAVFLLVGLIAFLLLPKAMFLASIGLYSLLHLAMLSLQIQAWGHGSKLVWPCLIAACGVFGYNRHMDAWVDDSPFAESITLYDQRIVGFPHYLRIFDQPNSEYGRYKFDLVGFFLAVEFLTFLVFLLEVSLLLWLRVWKQSKAAPKGSIDSGLLESSSP
jgi:hypothetical protein